MVDPGVFSTGDMADATNSWLEELGLGRYAAVFAEQEITLDALWHLTDDDLKELGLPLGPRRPVSAASPVSGCPVQQRAGSRLGHHRRRCHAVRCGYARPADALGPAQHGRRAVGGQKCGEGDRRPDQICRSLGQEGNDSESADPDRYPDGHRGRIFYFAGNRSL